ncbi:EI24 domain-containing protein [Leisingera sp. M527]|uniref:EI24 domain-containing protein n=1 Tax=unclassified Leisingera TaxID=2614906 RepID=UPI0021A8E932|nr:MULTISPECIES: EI24 domain-containing protein [unclassified Leisingera]UWQ29795.1 EI24 domain-containing protein [Leisingera sp. M523]UWQ34008.1 EI24 domain-containing protein [Leisingera sp. M527]UWQ75990.1 EI24 domain-containing protein [Leisingera sp. M658]
MIFTAFFKTLGQTGDPRFRKVLFLGLGLTIALLIAAYAGFLMLIQWLVGPEATLPLLGDVTWVDDLLSIGSLFFMLVLSVFLMVPVASAITSMFLEEVAQAVEDKHYPALPPAAKVPFWDAVRDTVNFLGLLIAANILALFLYVLFPPAALFIFWGLNGFLLGREYFTLAAARRIGTAEAKKLRRKHATTIWAAGTLMAMPLSVPLVNLVIPILGAATFTHIYHALSRR